MSEQPQPQGYYAQLGSKSRSTTGATKNFGKTFVCCAVLRFFLQQGSFCGPSELIAESHCYDSRRNFSPRCHQGQLLSPGRGCNSEHTSPCDHAAVQSVFLEKAQPGTPGIDAPAGGIAAVLNHGSRGDDLPVATDVKTEASWSVLNSGHVQDVIELSSSSGDDSSESETCSSTSGDDESIDLDEEEPVQCLDTGKQDDDGTCFMVKNCKTKIVHEIETGFAADTVASLSDLKGKMARCGHVVTANYRTVQELVDWTLKCRVCYKGRRGPSKA